MGLFQATFVTALVFQLIVATPVTLPDQLDQIIQSAAPKDLCVLTPELGYSGNFVV